jgi:threonine/homoserine/homoserine lactone efflux protein
MSALWRLALMGVALGLAYAAAPGAVNTEAMRRGSAHGSLAAALVETGSLLGDGLWAALALVGVSLTERFWPVQLTLALAGGFFLLRMAWSAGRDALFGRAATAPASRRGDFATGLVFGLANPVGLAFWSGLGSAVALSGVVGAAIAPFFGGFLIGAGLWSGGFALLVGWGRRWVSPLVLRMIDGLCACALGYFGLSLLATGARQVIERLAGGLLSDPRPAPASLVMRLYRSAMTSPS